MTEALRLLSLALFAVGPVVAVMALLRRGLEPSPMRSRIRSWRWYVPALLLPAEWLLPPLLIALRIGEITVSSIWMVRVGGNRLRHGCVSRGRQNALRSQGSRPHG